MEPLWNIIPDGTITDYTPTTISIDTRIDNTRIRKNDLAIATETSQKPKPPPQTQEPKPRLMHLVACKTVREYNRKKEKFRKFCLEEKRQLQRDNRQREEEDNIVHYDPPEEMAGTSKAPDTEFTTQQARRPTATAPQTGQQRKQTPSQKPTSVQKRRKERKRKKFHHRRTQSALPRTSHHTLTKTKGSGSRANKTNTSKETATTKQLKTTMASPYGS